MDAETFNKLPGTAGQAFGETLGAATGPGVSGPDASVPGASEQEALNPYDQLVTYSNGTLRGILDYGLAGPMPNGLSAADSPLEFNLDALQAAVRHLRVLGLPDSEAFDPSRLIVGADYDRDGAHVWANYDARPVFTLDLNGVTEEYSYRQYLPLAHCTAGQADGQSLPLFGDEGLPALLRDADGSVSADANLNFYIDDSRPEWLSAASLNISDGNAGKEGDLCVAAGYYAVNWDADSNGEGGLSVAWHGPLTAAVDGRPIALYTESGQPVEIAYDAAANGYVGSYRDEGGPRVAFTLSLDAASNKYLFDLKAPLHNPGGKPITFGAELTATDSGGESTPIEISVTVTEGIGISLLPAQPLLSDSSLDDRPASDAAYGWNIVFTHGSTLSSPVEALDHAVTLSIDLNAAGGADTFNHYALDALLSGGAYAGKVTNEGYADGVLTLTFATGFDPSANPVELKFDSATHPQIAMVDGDGYRQVESLALTEQHFAGSGHDGQLGVADLDLGLGEGMDSLVDLISDAHLSAPLALDHIGPDHTGLDHLDPGQNSPLAAGGSIAFHELLAQQENLDDLINSASTIFDGHRLKFNCGDNGVCEVEFRSETELMITMSAANSTVTQTFAVHAAQGASFYQGEELDLAQAQYIMGQMIKNVTD